MSCNTVSYGEAAASDSMDLASDYLKKISNDVINMPKVGNILGLYNVTSKALQGDTQGSQEAAISFAAGWVAGEAMKMMQEQRLVMQYDKIHKVLGQGNFVLMVSEGKFGANGGDHVSFYDLFRLENGQIVEHWDVIEPILPKEQWKNNNGKFGFAN